MDEDVKVLARADPALQQSLQSEVEPDAMDGEQTWPTEEELRQAEGWFIRGFGFCLKATYLRTQTQQRRRESYHTA